MVNFEEVSCHRKCSNSSGGWLLMEFPLLNFASVALGCLHKHLVRGSNWQGINGKLEGQNILHRNPFFSSIRRRLPNVCLFAFTVNALVASFLPVSSIEWFKLVLFYWIIKRYGIRENSFFNKSFETRPSYFVSL